MASYDTCYVATENCRWIYNFQNSTRLRHAPAQEQSEERSRRVTGAVRESCSGSEQRQSNRTTAPSWWWFVGAEEKGHDIGAYQQLGPGADGESGVAVH